MHEIVERAMQRESMHIALLVETSIHERRPKVDHAIQLARRVHTAHDARREMAMAGQKSWHDDLLFCVDLLGRAQGLCRLALADRRDAAIFPN
jgi:hypothetical protein